MPAPANSSPERETESEGADHLEVILLSCFQNLFKITSITMSMPIVRENLNSLTILATHECTHANRELVASLYHIKRNLAFREIRLCHYCFSHANTCLRELVNIDPLNACVVYFASLGHIMGYHRFVLLWS